MHKSIIWFRQDLRLNDNPALYNALKDSSHIIALYIFEQNIIYRPLGNASKWFLSKALIDLETNLKNHYNINLLIKKGDSYKIIENIIEKENVKSIYWNKVFEPYNSQIDTNIIKNLNKLNVKINTYNASLLTEPHEIKNKSGGYFKVFTPFYNTVSAYQIRPLISKPKNINKGCNYSIIPDKLNLIPPKNNWTKKFEPLWTVTEENAQNLLDVFLKNKLSNYTHGRDFPALECTSKLSPYLHFGLVSPHQIIHKLNKLPKDNQSEKLKKELYWREFSYSLMYNFYANDKNFLHQQNFNKTFDNFEWQYIPNKNFTAWEKGLTGFPIIDAGMRELWQTGWMHNRVRMIVASFLTKHLAFHWRVGEEWFWDCLLDADLANNSAGWQWVAGCGCDAAPFFRIFNPIIQGEKFDKEGMYIRKFIPELKNLTNEFIHKPWEAPQNELDEAKIKMGVTYPNPIINLEEARKKALENYFKLKLKD